jgi:hypothetical protein
MVTKHADGVDGANDGEDVEEMLLANVLVQVADVQRGGRRGGYNGGSRGRDGVNLF